MVLPPPNEYKVFSPYGGVATFCISRNGDPYRIGYVLSSPITCLCRLSSLDGVINGQAMREGHDEKDAAPTRRH